MFVPHEYGDRFIPRRYALNRNEKFLTNFNINKRNTVNDVLDMSILKGYWWSYNYLKNFHREFNLSPKSTSNNVIECHDYLGQYVFKKIDGGYARMVNVTVEREFSNCDWPCVPRKRPLAVVETTHDLPNHTNQISM